MAYILDKKAFIKKLPISLRKEFNFINKFDDSFFASDGTLKKNKIYDIKTSADNIKLIPKSLNATTTKAINTDFSIKDYKFRFIVSGKTSAGSKNDAKITQMQEKASLYICEQVFKNKKIEVSELVKIYPDLPNKIDWQKSFKAQEKVFRDIKTKYNFKPTVFVRDGGFMDMITKEVKKHGIRKKDTWNPADIWIHKTNISNKYKNTNSLSEINALMLKDFIDGNLCGISLKLTKEKATYEEVNTKNKKQITTPFIIGKLYLTLKNNKKEFLNDEFSFDLSHAEGIINAQVRMYPKSPNANVQISYKIKGSKAEFGKVSSVFRNSVYKNITGSVFPTGKTVINSKNSYLKEKDKIRDKINTILESKIIDTGISSFEEFDRNIESIFALSSSRYQQMELSTKMQGLEVAYQMCLLSKDDLESLVTQWSYISQKKGNEYGCFIKVY